MTKEPIKPRPPFKTQYGIPPESLKKRAVELPGIVSVWIRDLFPDVPETIYPSKEGINLIRKGRSGIEAPAFYCQQIYCS